MPEINLVGIREMRHDCKLQGITLLVALYKNKQMH